LRIVAVHGNRQIASVLARSFNIRAPAAVDAVEQDRVLI